MACFFLYAHTRPGAFGPTRLGARAPTRPLFRCLHPRPLALLYALLAPAASLIATTVAAAAAAAAVCVGLSIHSHTLETRFASFSGAAISSDSLSHPEERPASIPKSFFVYPQMKCHKQNTADSPPPFPPAPPASNSSVLPPPHHTTPPIRPSPQALSPQPSASSLKSGAAALHVSFKSATNACFHPRAVRIRRSSSPRMGRRTPSPS